MSFQPSSQPRQTPNTPDQSPSGMNNPSTPISGQAAPIKSPPAEVKAVAKPDTKSQQPTTTFDTKGKNKERAERKELSEECRKFIALASERNEQILVDKWASMLKEKAVNAAARSWLSNSKSIDEVFDYCVRKFADDPKMAASKETIAKAWKKVGLPSK